MINKKIISTIMAIVMAFMPASSVCAGQMRSEQFNMENELYCATVTDATCSDADISYANLDVNDEQLATLDNEVSPTGYIDLDERAEYYTSPYSMFNLVGDNSLPAKYDSRDLGYVTPVKNQRPYNTCWSFAAMAAGEYSMMTRGYADTPDFSEYQFAYFFYNDVADPLGNLKNDSTSIISESNYLELGGNSYYSMFALSSWKGMVDEGLAPYSQASVTSTLSPSLAFSSDAAHMQNAYVISMKNMDDVKKMIMEYGAVASAMYMTSYYCNSDTKGYYQNVSTTSNHAVTIIGWDDDFAVSNYDAHDDYTFSSSDKILPGVTVSGTPENPGAWLVKNSWGEGDYDYMWVSYEDPCTCNSDAFAFICEPADNYDFNYQYDGTSVVASGSVYNRDSISNVFTVNGADSEVIKAASIALKDDNVEYSLQFYLNPEEGKPTSGIPMLKNPQTGVTSYTGYYTIPLDEPFIVSKGDKVAVVFTLYNMDDTSEDGKVSIYIDIDGANGSNIKFDSYTEPGQMYYIYSDGEAIDYYKSTNDRCPRIKMFSTAYYDTVVQVKSLSIEPISDYTYTGSIIVPEVNVFYGDNRLTEGVDYFLAYSNNINAGEAIVTITGKGIYQGSQSLTYNILPADTSKLITSLIPDQTYTGEEIKPKVTVISGTKELTEGQDYSVSYSDNKYPGKAKVTITGKGNYIGTIETEFDIIVGLDKVNKSVISNQYYTGSGIKPVPIATLDGRLLENGKDYTLKYSNNTNIGRATITLTGKGYYSGSTNIYFNIVGKASDFEVSSVANHTYTGSARKPVPTVKYNGKELTAGTDYTLTYKNNINPGTATITVKGKGLYTGSKTITFKILGKASGFTVPSIADRTYTGKAIKPSPTIRFNGKKLVKGTDYTLSYSNNKKVGKATIIITGKGKYKGTRKVTFRIIGKADKFKVASISKKKYTGKEIKPKPTVKFAGKKLTYGKDYTLSYSNNKKVGTATITIKGKGYYKGTKKVKFTIVKK